MNQIKDLDISPHMHGHLIFVKEARNIHWEKTLIREESIGATQTALSLAGEPKPILPFASLRCGFLVFR